MVAPAELLPTCRALARDMLSVPDAALRSYKRIIDAGFALAFGEALAAERELSGAANRGVSPGVRRGGAARRARARPGAGAERLVKVRLGIGVSTLPVTTARAFFDWVELCERSDIDSLWQTDRLVSGQPFLESLSVMATLAGATERLKFGMNAVVAPLRDPLVLAKQCATIDWLSKGRLLPVFGVGGERAPEFAATGFDPKERGRRADEVLELCSRLWSEEKVDFAGKFYRYEGVSISPRPVQQPLPLWIGGSSPAAIKRTVRLGTGWLGGVQTPAQVGPVVAAIKELGAETGRPIPEDHFGASFAFRLGPFDDVARLARLRRARARSRRRLRSRRPTSRWASPRPCSSASRSTARSASRSSC